MVACFEEKTPDFLKRLRHSCRMFQNENVGIFAKSTGSRVFRALETSLPPNDPRLRTNSNIKIIDFLQVVISVTFGR